MHIEVSDERAKAYAEALEQVGPMAREYAETLDRETLNKTLDDLSRLQELYDMLTGRWTITQSKRHEPGQ